MSVGHGTWRSAVALLILAVAFSAWWYWPATPVPWTAADRETLRSLWIGSLEPLPTGATNAVAGDPDAAEFGHRLFFETRFSRNGAISCATCHQPQRRFTDGLEKAIAIGMSRRNTPSIVGAAYSPWLYWDGRRDSLWSQALSPLEDPNEHGSNRAEVIAVVASDNDYRSNYESLFGPLGEPDSAAGLDRAFANIGKAIAAYERLLLPGPSRFDFYVAALLGGGEPADILDDEEILGLQLFIGDANCTQCHNGPLFTNHEFHNTGVISYPGDVPDKGRVQGVREVIENPFNCRGEFSDGSEADCNELVFARTGPELIGAFRTPSLRNLEGTAPFMHKGQIATLAGVLRHYNEAPLAMIGHNEAKPLGLRRRQLRQLEAFLLTLDAPLAVDEKWLRPPDQVGGSESSESIDTIASL